MIVETTGVTAELVQAFQRLLPQLSQHAPTLSTADLEELVGSPHTTLLLACDDADQHRILGCLTLVVFRIPTGVRAWIEDVVVDGSARRLGIGEALVREAVKRALAAGARTVDLTSRPSRQAAHALYTKIGFRQRDTAVYRFETSA